MTDDLSHRFDDLLRHQEERDRAYAWPVEDKPTDRATRAEMLAESRPYLCIEQDPALIARVLADPDADEPRLAYARWHRERGTDVSSAVADFVEGQVRLAAALRADPHADVAAVLAPHAHAFASPDLPQWWRYPGGGPTGIEGALEHPLAILVREGLVDEPAFFRGFVEHVAMRAARFLELADELFALAPIRHLTLTYAKGPDHSDTALLDALLASPHLARIRSLRLPGRVLGNPYTELNRLTDEDLARFGTSRQLGALGYLGFVDQPALTIGGLDGLGRALPTLRVLRHELYRYGRVAGDYGEHTRELALRHDALPAIDGEAAIEATASVRGP
jgi:uncharacterized protein (TIGR02996 family)